MLFHRRQHTQITLNTSRVVIANILLDHLNKLVLAGEPSAVSCEQERGKNSVR